MGIMPHALVSALVIAAFNEETTVAEVVRVACSSHLGVVYVIDDGSTDATANIASQAGATVIKLPKNLGKGGVLHHAAINLSEDVLILLDADLVGLTPAHIHTLAEPVLVGEVDMTRGLFSGGRVQTTLAQYLAPQLSGQRAILREKLAAISELAESRYGVEIFITKHAKQADWRTRDVWLAGVSQVMKEEKRGFWRGFLIRLKMYADIARAYLRLN
jgi:glycosyltransferase involved in cell wall biosynthesis